MGQGGCVLERGEALIRLEGLCELDDAGHVLAKVGEVVVHQTAKKAYRDGNSKQGRQRLLTVGGIWKRGND